jgi:hypothetical protein
MRHKKTLLLMIGLVASVIIFYRYDGLGQVKRLVDPVGYWTKMQNSAKFRVDYFERMLERNQLELEQAKASYELVIRQSPGAGIMARNDLETYSGKVRGAEGVCKVSQILVDRARADLQHANEELAKLH